MIRCSSQSLAALRLRNPVPEFDNALRFGDTMLVERDTRATLDGDDASSADFPPGVVLWTHCYAVGGRAMPYSVSALLAFFFGEFERDAQAWRIARSPRTLADASYKYFQVGRVPFSVVWDSHVLLEHRVWRSADALFAHLARQGGEANMTDASDVHAFLQHYALAAYRALCDAWAQTAVRGSDEHLSAEAFYNGVYCPDLPRFQTPAFRQFLFWHGEWVRAQRLVPFRTELLVCDYRSASRAPDGRILEALCGSVDLVLADEREAAQWRPGQPLRVVVVDYKFNETISDYANGFARAPLDRVSASKREKQATQVAAYTAMIERNTTLRVRSAHVVQFTSDAYHVYDMPRERVAQMPAAFERYIADKRARLAGEN